MKTIRLKYPQWQGGVNPNYVLGAELLSAIVPHTHRAKEITIEINHNDAIEMKQLDGIDYGDGLLKQNEQAYRLLEEEQPDQIIVIGGDCAVTQVPFDYLSGKYSDRIGIIWLDAHPDISGTDQSSHLHEMVAANLLGQNPASTLTAVKHPFKLSHFIYAGLIEEELRSMDMRCKALALPIVSPDQLRNSSSDILNWIENNDIAYLAVHWDLDVLSPSDFRSIYPAEPYLDPKDFSAAVGQMTLDEVISLLQDVSSQAEIVGLSITEHMPWDALRLHQALSKLSLFKQ